MQNPDGSFLAERDEHNNPVWSRLRGVVDENIFPAITVKVEQLNVGLTVRYRHIDFLWRFTQ